MKGTATLAEVNALTPPSPHDGAARRTPLVAVIGGGISGLVAAWRLVNSPGVPRVVLFEQSDRFGGKLLLGTDKGNAHPLLEAVDLGAESMLARRREGVELLREIGLADDLVTPATRTASVLRDGTLHPLPTGTVLGVPGDPDRLRGVLTAAEVRRVAEEPGLRAEPVNGDVDVASWVAARVGQPVVDRLVEPLLGGVYAGHASNLSLRASVPALWRCAVEGTSVLQAVSSIQTAAIESAAIQAAATGATDAPVFAGLAGGLGRLPAHLAVLLAQRGVSLHTAATVRGLTRTGTGWQLLIGATPTAQVIDVDAVVLAVPPAPAARLLSQVCPVGAAELAQIETASVALVAAVLPRRDLVGVTGSGVLIPPIEGLIEGLQVKAITFSSAKWGWLDALDPDQVVLRMSLGRHREEQTLQHDDAVLAALAIGDASRLLARPLHPVAMTVVRWGGALPQYSVGHVDRIVRVRAAVESLPGLAICGAAFDGVGIPACIAAATAAAEAVLREPVAP